MTGLVLWLCGRIGVTARQPLWLMLIAFPASYTASTAAHVAVLARPTPKRTHVRVAVQIIGTTVIMYMTGWGPALSIGFVLVSHEIISADGSAAWPTALSWSLAGIAGGQVAIALGWAPTKLSTAGAQGLGALAVVGTALAIALLGLGAARAEMAERSLRASEEKLRTTVETATDAYLELDHDGTIRGWNARAEQMFGWTREEVEGKPFEMLLIADARRAEARSSFAGIVDGQADPLIGDRFETDLMHRSGRRFPVELAFWRTETENGRHLHAFVHDITARKAAQEALHSSVESFRLLFEQNPQPMWVFELEGHTFIEVNSAAVDHYGYSRAEFLEMRVDDIRPDEDRVALDESIGQTTTGVRHAGRWRHRTKSGQVIDVEITSHRLTFDGRPCSLVLAVDVTERVRAERKLRHQAMHDALTGLPNRTLLVDRLSNALARQTQDDTRVAAVFIDLDRFKVINDAMGHQMGDRLLAMVGERLSRAVRPTDIVARIGGDEFVVLLTGVRSEAETATAAARLAWSLDAPFLVDGHEFFVSASQGVALAEAGDTADDLLARADAAMYRAKDRGRSRWEWANQALRTQARERLGLESAIRRALDAEEFLLHYQPIVDVGSGGVVGAEALIRWEHPDGTLRQPAAFVPAAEDCGLIVPIGEWVLRRAVTDLGEGRLGSDPHIAVAVNLSAAQLSMRNLAFAVARALSLSGVDPERLHLEITESVLMHDLENCTLTLETLRGLGVSIDVDDFGTGYSSLSYVQKLPVNTLKIDKSFIDRLSGPRPDESIVTAILALAESSNLTVVAEGVEDEVQHETLRRLGCAHAQGFLFARPMPADQFATYADSHPLVPLGIQ